MNDKTEKSWFDSLSEILSAPLPGTDRKPEPVEKPVVFGEHDDDESLLDKITDILSQPLPGTEPPTKPAAARGKGAGKSAPVVRENPGEVAVKEAESPDADPVSTTAAAGADWMQREYERFNAYQERNRQAFAEAQRQEQERFFAYQRQQMQQFMQSQERERQVLGQHQQARFQNWRQDIQRNFAPPPGAMPPGMMPPPPPPPPPWWRKR